ncbi:hypothetical protein O181_013662 [Austropuccinia psidii MF-1]|uniref:Uncharacterized protein n=1 Tax=Austropuccinia psidii MF-1 TaxID=1389203 RepID=A0A9Q3BYR9_9BASI|nr:hypothetical protein [Austropuccinia psidii MF-1]
MGDAIRENSDYEKDPIEELLLKYQKETQLEIQDTQLEAGLQQDTENKNLQNHTTDVQTFKVILTKGMEYINGKATKMTVCIENAQNPLIINRCADLPSNTN